MLIVLDTNVLVSSLLKPASNPGLILASILDGRNRLAIDERILDEYAHVLQRPRFQFKPPDVDTILRILVYSSLWVKHKTVNITDISIVDPDDLKFGEVALIGNAEYIVTGNMKHFLFMRNTVVKVVTPQEFVKHSE